MKLSGMIEYWNIGMTGKKKVSALLIICALLYLSISACAASHGELEKLFKESNEAYKIGDYSKSIESFHSILSRYDIESPQIFYNLGNAYFKNNKVGYAILYYEKAHRLLPRDRDIRFNLEFARQGASGGKEEKANMPLLSNICTINELTISVSILYFAFMALLILYCFFKKEKLFFILTVSGILFILGLFMLGVGIYQTEYIHYGIVVAPSAELRGGPDLSEGVTCILPEGARLKVLREEENWVEVSVPGRSKIDNPSPGVIQGWIPGKDIVGI